MDQQIITKLDAFFSSYPLQTYAKGETIIAADEEPRGIYYIEAGVIRCYYLSSEGVESTLNLYKPHSFLPMSWAMAQVKNQHWYEAMGEVKARCAPKEDVLAFMHTEPEIMYDLLRRVYIGIEGLWTHVESLAAGNATMKLAAMLVILAKRFGKKTTNGIQIALAAKESDLASLSGMTRETTSRELQKLKKQKLLTFSKSVLIIHDLEALEHLLLT